MQRLFHTPEGFRDVYNGECRGKRKLQENLHSVFEKYDYEDIETPTIEYFEVFSQEVGTIPSKDLYKFFDREGNTLVLRADFTPSVARAAAMYFMDEKDPLRFCYQGSTFINNSNYQGRLKESTQMGVELIGDDRVEADAEVLGMTVDLLKAAGLTEFQISIGQVDYFKSLVDEAQLEDDTVEAVRSMISNKNYFGVEELLDAVSIRKELKEAFMEMPQLFGGVEVLAEAKKLSVNERTDQAIQRLEAIYEILDQKGYGKYVSFDFGMLSKYQYYTGIIFQAYTYGTGEPVAKGGRYDNLLEHFGKSAPAVGVGIYIEQLMNGMTRQGIKMGE